MQVLARLPIPVEVKDMAEMDQAQKAAYTAFLRQTLAIRLRRTDALHAALSMGRRARRVLRFTRRRARGARPLTVSGLHDVLEPIADIVIQYLQVFEPPHSWIWDWSDKTTYSPEFTEGIVERSRWKLGYLELEVLG